MRKTKNEEFSQEVPRFHLLLFVKARVVYQLRKNWLFSSSVDGAEASMNIYTIIEMAKLHGLNRQKYIEYILEHRPSAEMTDEELSLLAPWNKDVQETCEKCDH